MEIKEAIAGTLESGDIMIRIVQGQKPGVDINLSSSVAYQFRNLKLAGAIIESAV